jgi:hypothetical protein
VTSQVVHTEHLQSSKEHSDGTESNAERASISETESAGSYDLICSQLRAGIEKRVVQLSKSVISDLERRLLLRQQSDWFATFLVALILLNCVERTCWSFLSWNEEKSASRVSIAPSPYCPSLGFPLLIAFQNYRVLFTFLLVWPSFFLR